MMKLIGQCKDCKYWDDDSRYCGHPYICENMPSDEIADEPITGKKIMSRDSISVQSDFGCIYWRLQRGNE